jgi:hypothetical protein
MNCFANPHLLEDEEIIELNDLNKSKKVIKLEDVIVNVTRLKKWRAKDDFDIDFVDTISISLYGVGEDDARDCGD